jgi:hypothetical protein
MRHPATSPSPQARCHFKRGFATARRRIEERPDRRDRQSRNVRSHSLIFRAGANIAPLQVTGAIMLRCWEGRALVPLTQPTLELSADE